MKAEIESFISLACTAGEKRIDFGCTSPSVIRNSLQNIHLRAETPKREDIRNPGLFSRFRASLNVSIRSIKNPLLFSPPAPSKDLCALPRQ